MIFLSFHPIQRRKKLYIYVYITHTFFSLNIDPEIVFLIWGLFSLSLFLQPFALSPLSLPKQAQVETLQYTFPSLPPGMALSSRAHAFSVEALVGRPSKRKLQDPREEVQPELQEKEGRKEAEERRSGAAGKKSEQPGKYPYRTPKPRAGSCTCWIGKSQTSLQLCRRATSTTLGHPGPARWSISDRGDTLSPWL